MPRELSNERCEITFDDRISGGKLTLYHRMPTSEERIKYANGYVTRQGNTIVSTIGELRMKAGSAIFTGFKTGAFSAPGKGLISSDKSEPNYEPAWKALIKQYSPDVIEMLAVHVFESSLVRNAAPANGTLEILPATGAADDWAEDPGATSAQEAKPAGDTPEGGEAVSSPLP
jgi:hypothetical protein